MISNLIPAEATQSSLIYLKSLLYLLHLKINSLKKLVVAHIVQNNGNVLRTHATEAAQGDTTYLVNNPLSSFFPNAQGP